MNNKLLKRFLITTALGAASFSGIADVMAVITPVADAVVGTTLTILNAAQKESYNFTKAPTIDANGLTINHNPVNGQIDAVKADAGVANANIIVNGNNAAAADYIIASLTGSTDANGTAFKITTDVANSTLKITEVTGTGTSVIVDGANNKITFNKVGTKDAAVKSLEVTGNAASILTVDGDSYAKEYKVAAGTLGFIANGNKQIVEGDAKLSDPNSKFGFSGGKGAATGNITYTGNITTTTAGEGGVGVVAGANDTIGVDVVISGQIGVGSKVAVIGLGNQNAATKSTLTLKNKSEATNYMYNANGTLILDSTGFDKNNATFTHKGAFVGGTANATDANAVLRTQGTDVDVTIAGTVNGGKLEVGTKNGATTIVTGMLGDTNLTAVEFLEKTTLKLTGGTNVGTTVNFGGKEGIIDVNGNNATFAALTNINGSTIKVTSNNNLTFAGAVGAVGAVGKTGDLLTVDASKVTKADNYVQVSANDNMFDLIDTGAGKLKAADGATIYAKEIKGGNIFADQGFTIKAVDKTIKISSKKVQIDNDKTLTITAEDFGTFASEIAVVNGAINTALVLNGSGTIDLGAAATVAKFSIADANRTVTLNNTSGNNLSHNIGALEFGAGTVNLASNFTNKGALTVEGTLNLDKFQYKSVDNGAIALNKANLIVSGDEKQNGNIFGNIAVAADKVNISVAKDATFTSATVLDYTGNTALLGTQINLTKSKNLFTVNDYSFKDANGAEQKGNAAVGKTLILTNTVDNAKFKTVLDSNSSPVTGNFKKFTDALQKEGVDKLKDAARSYIIKAGSADSNDKSIAHLAGALPRNTVETQKNVMRVNQSGLDAINSVVRARAAGAASDDLKTNASIWAKGTYGKGTQEVSDIYSSAYDSSMFGATIGAEFGLGESLTVGAAGSYTQTTVTYKGLRTDEDKFKSIYGSLYGFANLESNFVLNASMTFGSTKIDGKTVSALTANSSDDAQITSMSYGGALLGGYKADFSSLSVTPLVGIGFSKFENPARKTAEGAITTKAYDTSRVDLIAGLSVAGEIKTASDMVIVPEIHGFAYYNVKDVEKQVTLDMQGLQNNVVSYLSNDTTKTNFTIGASVTAKSGMVEYGASVDGQFADKYSAVLGSLKLKVNL
jgi:hypothetical protein